MYEKLISISHIIYAIACYLSTYQTVRPIPKRKTIIFDEELLGCL
jgi:hypothetical protein